MPTATVANSRPVKIYPLLTVEERLGILKKLQGAWKHRKTDPVQELEEIRDFRKIPRLEILEI